MLDAFVNLLKESEVFFKEYQFVKEFFITCLAVVLGGIITILINRWSIRKQSFFDLQYRILNELIEQVYCLEKSIENLEIHLSFGDGKMEPFENEIISVERQALVLNEGFREKRMLIHRGVTGVMLEESAKMTGKIYRIFYDNTKGSIYNKQRKKSVSNEDVESLRELTRGTRELKNKLQDSLEQLIFPGMLSRIIRKIKKAKVSCGNLYGIWKVNK